MQISIELLITVGSFVFLVAAFFVTRNRDAAGRQAVLLLEAEAKGKLLQRVAQLENSVDEAHNKCRDNTDMVNIHGTDLARVTGDIKNLTDLTERIEKKIDRVLERGDRDARGLE